MKLHTRIHGDPGASAEREAERLRRLELPAQHRRALRWLAPLLILWFIVATALSILLPLSIAALVATGPLWHLLRHIYAPGPAVQRWRAGAAGERRTARVLRRLNGWALFHDCSLPDSRANADHVAVIPDGRGAVLINTKTTRGGGTVRLHGDTLVIGRSSYPRAVPGTLHESQSVQRALGVPVHPVIAVDGADVPGGRLEHRSGLTVVPASRLHRVLARVPHQPDEAAFRALVERAAAALPSYTG
ncbi:nuclease-related domain-containing protein [Streptomyces sp. NPDC047065]|uniref:nuclease-related domain-containing protein n=1 Tax=Streptomyces sp. NPDC047065 TaxID=3154606 RepID=UPI0033FC01AC